MNAVELIGVSKRYRLGEQLGTGTARDAMTGWLRRVAKRRRSVTEEIWSLRDVSFEVGVGESVGIIGRNGAGKSTALKVITRIVHPTSGLSRTRGRVGSLLEVGTGFHPELTGRENVYLNGVILGMSRRDIAARFDDIVEFAGVPRFLDTPVKRYSSGMYLRLAFAVAAHLEPDVLVVDEVLAVGDVEFQRRCLSKMAEAEREGRTVVFVSHDMDAVSRLCTRGVWLDQGQVNAIGGVNDVIDAYLEAAAATTAEAVARFDGVRHGPLELVSLAVLDKTGRPSDLLRRSEPFTVEIRFRLDEAAPAFDAALIVTSRRGVRVLDEVLSDSMPTGRGAPGDYVARVEVPPVLNVGQFDVGLWFGTAYDTWFDHDALLSFHLEGGDHDRPDRVACLDLPWDVRRDGAT